MKKLLCLLLSVLPVLLFTACGGEEYEYIEETTQYTQPTTTVAVVTDSYDNAIRLMMKSFSDDLTKEEFKSMFPDTMWTYFKGKHGKSFDQIYEDFSAKMDEVWTRKKQEYGEDAVVKYELLDRVDYDTEDYEAFKTKMEETYGISRESFGIGYTVYVKQATVGNLKEEIFNRTCYVVEIDGKWYVTLVLTDMLGL